MPYLAYAVFKYYDLLSPHMNEIADKKTYEDMYIAAIVIVVLLSISSIIFISFYFKNYTKRAFAQDKISIKDAFQKISREIAQHAADEYSDEQVNNHIEDMSTLGGRIMAAKQGDAWYSDPKEFRKNYDEIPGEGYRRFQRKSPPQEVASSGVPAIVQGAINNPFGAPPVRQPTQEQLAQGRQIQNTAEKAEYYAEEGYSPEEVKKITSNPFNAPYVPW